MLERPGSIPMARALFFLFYVGLPAGRISAHWGGHGHYRPAQPHAIGAHDGGVATEDEELVDSPASAIVD